MRTLIKFCLTLCVLVLVGCSKTNMQLVPAKKDVILETRMMDNEAASLLLAATTKKERVEAIAKIDRTASGNFNWQFFWNKLQENKFHERIGAEEQAKLYELSFRSCLSEAQVSFLKFGFDSPNFSPLLEIIKKNNCELILVDSTDFLDLTKKVTPENLDALAKIWSLTKYKLKKGENYWQGILDLEASENKIKTLVSLGEKNIYTELEQQSFYELHKALKNNHKFLYEVIEEGWKKGGLQKVNFEIFKDAGKEELELSMTLVHTWKKCLAKKKCFEDVDFNDWLGVISNEILAFNDENQGTVNNIVEDSIEITSNYCEQARLDKIIDIILDSRVKKYDLVEKINCNIQLSLEDIGIVFERYKEAFENAQDEESKKKIALAVSSYFTKNNIFVGNRSWFQAHFNKYINTWKKISNVISNSGAEVSLDWVLYLQRAGESSYSLVNYNESLFVESALKKNSNLSNLVKTRKVAAENILRLLVAASYSKVVSGSPEAIRKIIWKNFTGVIKEGLNVASSIENAWEIKIQFNQIIKDYIEVNSYSENTPTLNQILSLKSDVLNHVQGKFSHTDGYESFLLDKQMDLDANFLMLKIRDQKSATSELGKNYHIDYSTAESRFFSMAKLDRIDSLKIFLRLANNRSDHSKSYDEYCAQIGGKIKIQANRDGKKLKIDSSKISGAFCHELSYKLVEQSLNTFIDVSRTNINDYTVIKTFGSSLEIENGALANGHIDLTQEFRHPRAKRAEKTSSYDGWSIPMYVTFKMQKAVSISKDGYLINFKTGDYVVFRYHHVKEAEQGPKYIEPKVGLNGGDLRLKRAANGFVPTIVSFGGIGQEAGEASLGGEAIYSEVANEERYDSNETEDIKESLVESCYEQDENNPFCELIEPHYMNEVKYKFFKDFVSEYIKQTNQFGFNSAVVAFTVENESRRTKKLPFCEEYLQKEISANGDNTDLTEYTVLPNGKRKQNCDIYLERRIEKDIKKIANREPDDSSNMDYFVPELAHGFDVAKADQGEVFHQQFAELGKAGVIKAGDER